MPYNGKMRTKNLGATFILIIVLMTAGGCGSSVAIWTDGEVPFVRSTPAVIDRMLEMAQVKPDDVVYDIGSGDGAIVIRAAKKYGVKGVGIEIDQGLVTKARDNAFREKCPGSCGISRPRRLHRRRFVGDGGDLVHVAGF